MKRILIFFSFLCLALSLHAMTQVSSLSDQDVDHQSESSGQLASSACTSQETVANKNQATPSVTVTVVDLELEKLDTLSEPGSPTYIFGATPRYAQFATFVTVLKEQLDLLKEYSVSSKALKGVSKEVKNTFRQLIAQGDPAELIARLSFDLKMKLFFSLGFQEKLLQENFIDLCDQVSTHARRKPATLVHVLLPCYLDGCTALGESEFNVTDENNPRPLTEEKIRRFLKESAQYYKRKYETIQGHSIRVILVMPQVSYFQKMLAVVKKGPLSLSEKEESICAFLQNEILTLTTPKKNSLIIVNQNSDEIGYLIKRLIALGADSQLLNGLYLTIRIGIKPTIVFNPYLLSINANLDYKTSPLIKKELLLNLLPEENHDQQS